MSPSGAMILPSFRTLATFSATSLRVNWPGHGHLPLHVPHGAVLHTVCPTEVGLATWARQEIAIAKLFIKIYDCHFLVQ